MERRETRPKIVDLGKRETIAPVLLSKTAEYIHTTTTPTINVRGLMESEYMKRPHTALIVAGTAITTLLGLSVFAPSANATRTAGIESGSMASVDVFTLIDRALSTEAMKTERVDYETQSNAALSGMQQRFVELQQQLGGMQPNDPNANTLYQEYQALQSNLQRASQQASDGYQTLIAKQIASAYTEIYAAANEVATEQGFAFVFATRSDGELLQTDTITGITQEILARPLVTPPSATNLTEAIRAKLGYPDAASLETLPLNDPAATEQGTPAVEPAGSDE